MSLKLDGLKHEVTRHGRHVWYVRFGKGPRARLEGVDQAPPIEVTRDVLAAYERASDALKSRKRELPDDGSIAWLAEKFQQSRTFRDLDPQTRKYYRSAFRGLVEERGALPYARLEPRHVARMRDRLGGHAGNKRLRVIKRLYSWAAEAGHVSINPAREVKRVQIGSRGFTPWTRDDLAKMIERHPPGTKAHLATSLLLYTACRRGDVVRFGPLNIRGDRVVYIQEKNQRRRPRAMNIPLLRPLRESIAAAKAAGEIGETTLLVTEYGQPITKAGFGAWFRKRCMEAGLPDALAAHGLRKLTGIMAAEGGASAKQIQELLGHSTVTEAETYIREANRALIATAGFGAAFGPED